MVKALKRQKLQVRRNVKKVEKAQEDEAAVGTQEEEPVVTQEVPWTEVTIPKKRLTFLKDDNPAEASKFKPPRTSASAAGVPPRTSTRLQAKKQFKFKNTEDDPVTIGD
ncbi:hypothetical protein ACET3Z_011327 [Daucus carota]